MRAGWAQGAIVCLAGEEKPEPGSRQYGINKDPGKQKALEATGATL